MAYLGIDLGTGGVRVVVVGEEGEIHDQFQVPIESSNKSQVKGESEQDPNEWIRALATCLDKIFSHSTNRNIKAISVDGTSGSVLPVNKKGKAIGNALMHNDMRAVEQSDYCDEVFGSRCSPTFALPKILWMIENKQVPESTLFLHATDFIFSWLSGTVDVPTDFTNALKTGVDLETEDWTEHEIFNSLNLPSVIAPGKAFGYLCRQLVSRWGLAKEVLLVSGATDSNAAFYASGASKSGDWTSTIGTTLAIKGLSLRKLSDSEGRIYCHKHPDGLWLPGGASNAGGEIIRSNFSGREQSLEAALAKLKGVTPGLLYPSTRVGERLPVSDQEFLPFSTLDNPSDEIFYLSCLEGIAYTEKLIFEILESLGASTAGSIYAMGGTTRSNLGLQIRSNLLGKSLMIPRNPDSVFGAAILAASGYNDQSVALTSSQMVRLERVIEPHSHPANIYQEKYLAFKSLCLDEN